MEIDVKTIGELLSLTMVVVGLNAHTLKDKTEINAFRLVTIFEGKSEPRPEEIKRILKAFSGEINKKIENIKQSESKTGWGIITTDQNGIINAYVDRNKTKEKWWTTINPYIIMCYNVKSAAEKSAGFIKGKGVEILPFSAVCKLINKQQNV